MSRVWGWLLAGFALLVAGIAWFSRDDDDQPEIEARDAAQAAEHATISERRAKERAEILRQREREQEAIQDDLETDLLQVETDLPGAVADALRDARGGSDDGAG